MLCLRSIVRSKLQYVCRRLIGPPFLDNVPVMHARWLATDLQVEPYPAPDS